MHAPVRSDSTDRSSHHGAGLRATVLAAVCFVLSFAVLVASALGAPPVYQSSFGSASLPAGEPQGLTVDQSNGDVYAIDATNSSVHRFTAAGAPDPFTAGPDSGTNTLTGFGGFFQGQVAVDRSGGPSDGNIYVLDLGSGGTGQVNVFSNAGAPLGAITGAGTPLGSWSFACGVAVDQSNGDLYIGTAGDFTNGNVFRYSPSSSPVIEGDYSGGITAEIPVCNVAVAQGILFASSTGIGSGDVIAYQASAFATGIPPSPTGTPITTGATTLDANPATGEVYVDGGDHISVFAPTGAHFFDFGSASDFGSSAGVAVTGSSGTAYVADPAAHQIDVFAPPGAATPPTATTNAATTIDHTTATLNGHLDPRGDPSISDCHFEWGTDTTYGHTAPCAEGNTFASPADVHAGLSGLHPGSTYHYRLDITGSASGLVTGDDQSFTATAFPVVTDPATDLHHTDVVLHGNFDPQSDPNLYVTACSFDWVTDAQFQKDQFASAASLPCVEGQSFSSAQSVSALLNNLTPGTAYHFRLHLTTAGAGEFTGAVQSVTPPLFPTISPQIAAFGPDGTSSSSFTTFNPTALAFDQAAKRLYASDYVAHTIYGFDASGPDGGSFSPLPGFAPLSAPIFFPPGLAVDNSSQLTAGRLYLGSGQTTSGDFSSGKLFGYDSAANPLGGAFPIDPATNPDPGTNPGIGSPKVISATAVDSAGDVWLANEGTDKILRYSSSGTFISSLDVSTQFSASGFALSGLAFDSHDNLYVSQTLGAVWRFAAPAYATATQIESNSGTSGIAVDPSTDDLYVTHATGAGQSDVTSYDPSGALQSIFGTGIPDSNFGGVAVDATARDVYVGDGGYSPNQGTIRVFHVTTQKPPTITQGPVTAITGSSATLNAKVDPENIPVTDCHFDYGTTSSYGNTSPCVPDPGSGSGDVAVHADLSSLNAGSTYHFRISASNAEAGGTATGPDQSFATLGPAISATSADHISDTAATLHAQVNPRGLSTTYQFQYTGDADFQANGFSNAQTAPASPAPIGSGNSLVAVAERLSGLSPVTTYHFRLVAHGTDGTDLGPAATFATFASSPGGPDSCPNAALRTGPSAALPDCRAYEQVSPVDKNGAAIEGSLDFNQAAADGHAAVFGSRAALPTSGGSFASPAYVASRGPLGWSYDGALPATGGGFTANELGRDDQLRVSLSAVQTQGNAAGSLFSTDLSSFSRQSLLSVPAANKLYPNPQFAADTSHFIFESVDVLSPDAADNGPKGSNLYDYDHGTLTLAGRVPAFPATSCTDGGSPSDDCTGPSAGSFAGSYDTVGDRLTYGQSYKQNTISADGRRVFFTESGSGRLYERLDGNRTIQLNADQGGNDPSGHKPAAFLGATPDGHTVYFSTCERLTPDSTAVSTAANTCHTSFQGQDLYAYHTQTGDLTDLSVDSTGSDVHGAQVQGLLGASPDGAYVYFAANGVLAPGAIAGEPNLYLSHGGQVSFVARLDSSNGLVPDNQNWKAAPGEPNARGTAQRTSRVAADGILLFSSTGSLTGYDNTGPLCNASDNGPGPCAELYRYGPGDAGPVCVSCDPSGTRPLGAAVLGSVQNFGLGSLRLAQGLGVLSRNLSASGDRVFFETPDKLVSADVNGDEGCPHPLFQGGPVAYWFPCRDVYMWEADGAGSCHSQAQDGGCLFLLSSGDSGAPSYFDDASASGDDVFIYTGSPLVPQDADQLSDLYDVRVGGGLAAQHQVAPPSCTGDTCQGTPSGVPAVSTAASVTFSGPGNATPGVATAKVHVLSKTVHGSTLLLKVSVPGEGRITISGAGIGTVGKTVSKAGTYTLRVTLTTKEKRLLRPKRKLKLKLRVSYAQAGGGASSSLTFSITDKG